MTERRKDGDTPKEVLGGEAALARVADTLAIIRGTPVKDPATEQTDVALVADARTIVEACAAAGVVTVRP